MKLTIETVPTPPDAPAAGAIENHGPTVVALEIPPLPEGIKFVRIHIPAAALDAEAQAWLTRQRWDAYEVEYRGLLQSGPEFPWCRRKA